MYNHDEFMRRVKLANPKFNRMADARGWEWKRSSLTGLISVLERANGFTIADVVEQTQRLPSRKLRDYRDPIDYLMQQTTGEVQPNNFSWLTGYRVGGMSKFDQNHDMPGAALWLYKNGIRTVISIESDGAEDTRKFTAGSFPNVKWFSCFLADWHAPSVEHLLKYCEKIEERLRCGAVVTHCWGGTGRTGCFLAAWSIYSRLSQNATEAFPYVRMHYNNHSVEMKAQYNALARFSDHLGRPASEQYDSLNHAGGHWHLGHQDDGLQDDPGHIGAGDNPERAFRTMLSSAGARHSRSPYLTETLRARIQAV